MSQETKSTTAKIRFTRELLIVIDEWAIVHRMPRSVAVRMLLLRGLAWDEALQQRTEALEELERESPNAETGEQWADICAREAEVKATIEPQPKLAA
jgi:hypothetical protein